MGSLLYAMDTSYPALVASGLFIVNIIICLLTIPRSVGNTSTKQQNSSSSKLKPRVSFIDDLISLRQYRSSIIGPLICLLLITFVERSVKETNILSYFEIRYDMDTKNIGFVNSISSLFAFLANTLLVKPFISFWNGSKEKSMVFALVLCAIACVLELLCVSIYHYILLVVPMFMISSNVVMTLSKSVLSCSVPHEHVGKTLAVFGVLESVVGVVAPLYGAHMFTKFGYNSRGWLGGIHYAVSAVLLWFTLVKQRYNSCTEDIELKKKK